MGSKGEARAANQLVDLELKHLSKEFDGVEIIKDLSLQVKKGELLCLLGPSGCGKTTMLKMIAGFLEPDDGSIFLDGKDITNLSPQKRNVGMVFQTYALFPHLNVYENIAYGLRRRKKKEAFIKSKVKEVLQLVQLDGFESRRIHEISGGQQQRIALARVLITEPKMLLLDEPLSNLDARLRADMRKEIRIIQRKMNITTVHVTHDQEEAMSIADRVVIMNLGRIEQIGTPRVIYEKPASLFVSDFIGRANFVQGYFENDSLYILGKQYSNVINTAQTKQGITCVIRPERIKLKKNTRGEKAAIVKEMTYLGAVVRYGIEVSSGKGAPFLLYIETPGPEAVYSTGDQVDFLIEGKDILVINKQGFGAL